MLNIQTDTSENFSTPDFQFYSDCDNQPEIILCQNKKKNVIAMSESSSGEIKCIMPVAAKRCSYMAQAGRKPNRNCSITQPVYVLIKVRPPGYTVGLTVLRP